MNIITTGALLALLVGCGAGQDEMSVSFSEGRRVERPKSPQPPKSEDVVVAEPIKKEEPIPVGDEIIHVENGVSTEFFLADKIEQAIDLVWVMDNSGSMGDEIAKVRDNFAKFNNDVSSLSKLNMAVISGGELSDLGDTYENLTHVEANVGSHSPLKVFSAAVCDERGSKGSRSIFDDTEVCGYMVQSEITDEDAIESSRGKLKEFFRPESKHVVIVVTDDDAGGVDEKNFQKILKRTKVNPNLEVYGFIGKSGSYGCDMASRGRSYEAIASKTGGKTFDICEDWTKHFKELTKSVLQFKERPLKLQNTAKKVRSIKVGDKTLSRDQWEMTRGNVIILKNVSLDEDSEKISVTYEW